MTPSIWKTRRHTGGIVAAASFLAMVSTVVPTVRAAADPLSSKRAQAQALASKIQALGQQEAALSEQYDAANLAVQAADTKVAQASRALADAEAAQAKARATLAQEAVNAYIHGGAATNQASAAVQPLGTINEDAIRSAYVGQLAATQSDAMDNYRLSALQAQDAKVALQKALTVVQQRQQAVSHDRQAVQASATQVQQNLDQVKGQIVVLVAQAQAAQRAAAARAEQAALAAARARQAAAAAAAQAQAQAQQAVTTSGLGNSGPPPPSGHGAGAAVAAAESRLGDPYVWGASGPGAFDCSGLTMWAWAQAGVSLPHFSGAQYADTVHIPISDVQPGDLVFPADPSEHVAMYVGGGAIIEAPYTGAVVHIIPLSSFFVLAGRVG